MCLKLFFFVVDDDLSVRGFQISSRQNYSMSRGKKQLARSNQQVQGGERAMSVFRNPGFSLLKDSSVHLEQWFSKGSINVMGSNGGH